MGFLSTQRVASPFRSATSSPAPPPFPSPAMTRPVGCLIFSSDDLIRILRFPPGMDEVVRDAVRVAWPKGIQRAEASDGGYEFKLNGTPWSSGRLQTNHLILALLATLELNGWHLFATPSLSRKDNPKDTLLFRPGLPRQRTFCAITFQKSRGATLVNASDPGLRQAFLGVLQSQGISKQNDANGALGVKLKNSIWKASTGAQVCASRILICDLISAFAVCGYDLVGCINVSAMSAEDVVMAVLGESLDDGGWADDANQRDMDMLVFASG